MPEDEDKDKQIADLQRKLGVERKRATDAEARATDVEGNHAKALADAEAAGEAKATKALAAEHARESAEYAMKLRAARLLADPEDVTLYIKPDGVIDAAGKLDPAKFDAAVTELLERKDYLAAKPGAPPPPPPPPPRGDGDGGPRPPAPRTDPDARANDFLRQGAKPH